MSEAHLHSNSELGKRYEWMIPGFVNLLLLTFLSPSKGSAIVVRSSEPLELRDCGHQLSQTKLVSEK